MRQIDAIGLKSDAKETGIFSIDLQNAKNEIDKQIPEKLKPLFDRLAKGVTKANKEFLGEALPTNTNEGAIAGIRFTGSPIEPAIEKARQANIALIKKANGDYVESVFDKFGSGASDFLGMRVEELTAQLAEREDVSQSRAELIARDQTLKLMGDVNQIKQTSAGIDQYVWSTSLDERVREEHRVLEGTVQDWLNPPTPGHPGDDYQCRCVAIPYVPELDEP